MFERATTWLDALDSDQRRRALQAFAAHGERRRWFYTPTDHGGLPLAEMTPAQQGLAMALLGAGLSLAGYATVATVMGLENVLDRTEGFTQSIAGRSRGRDPQMYYVAIFGSPSMQGTWSWRFGGHHVSVHHLIVQGSLRASTPCFLGASPASVPLLGPHLLRPLGGVEDLGRELLHSLDDGQLAEAVIATGAPLDIVGGNRSELHEGDEPPTLADIWRDPPPPERAAALVARTRAEEARIGFSATDLAALRLGSHTVGLAAQAMREPQRELLRALLDTYLGRLPDEVAEIQAARYAGAALDEVRFAWAGAPQPGRPHYYRISGPRLLVEYDNAQNDANHIHSVWRDPVGDFGADVLGEHLLHHH